MFRTPIALSIAAVALAGGALHAAEIRAPVNEWTVLRAADGLPSDKVFAILADGPRIWAGTDEGLARIDGRTLEVQQIWTEADGLPFKVVTALALDSQSGDVWVGTLGGLARLSAGRVDAFTQLNSGLANNVIYGVAVDGRDVWVATAAGLSRYAIGAKSWEIFDTTNTLMHEPWCYAVSADHGTVYVAVWGSGVVVRDGATGRFRVHRDPDGEMEIDLFRDDGLVHDVTSGITYDDGILWVGTYFGLSRYDGRRWQSFSATDSGLAGDFINFVKAHDGAVWIGTDQGLSRFDSTTWHTWHRMPDGNRELRVTGADGRSRTTLQDAGPLSDTVYGIDLTAREVWLATAAGVSRGTLAGGSRTKRSTGDE